MAGERLIKLGDRGRDVANWRVVLAADRYGIDGPADEFTKSVHNATVAWQKARGLKPDGVVGPKSRALAGSAAFQRGLATFDPDAIPYVEAKNWTRAAPAQRKDLIVIHCMEVAEASTTAEWCAGYFAGAHGAAPEASAHYCVDDDTVICCVPDDRIAWHAPGANRNGIGVEHAGYARQNRAQWVDDFSLRMLALSSQLTAWLMRRHAIPLQFVVADHVKLGGRGITTHEQVSKAYGKSSHWDPGPHFPIGDYLRMVADARDRTGAPR